MRNNKMRDYIDLVLIVGVSISIFLGILGSIAIPNNAQFGFIIGLFSTIITLLIDIGAKLSKSINQHEKSEKKLFKIIRDQLSIQEHDSEIFDEIIDDFFEEFREKLNNLAQGFLNVGDGYLTVNDLFRSGAGAIKRTKNQVLAVEAGSNYDKWLSKPNFQSYHKLAIEAIKVRKVNFERIWIIDRDQAEYYKVWKQHRRDGIKTYFVHEADLPDYLLTNLDYLDFAIIDEQIILRSRISVGSGVGGGKRYEGGQISIVKEHVNAARKRFHTIKNYAREFTG
jgi:hypothetical protein